MTGEVFGALKDHTILGRLMRDGRSGTEGFARGVKEGAALGSAGALLNRVFATRTYGLMDRLAGHGAVRLSQRPADRRRGRRGGAAGQQRRDPIIASAALAQRYTDALRPAGAREHACAGRIASRPGIGASRAPRD